LELAERKVDAMNASDTLVAEWIMRGRQSWVDGNFEDSRHAFRQAVSLDPGNSEATYGVALTSLAEGDTATAKEYFGRVLDATPDLANAMYNLGMVALLAKDLPSAQRWFQRTLDVDPHHRPAAARLASLAAAE
jgi:Tfp pilus assembly protein PilF